METFDKFKDYIMIAALSGVIGLVYTLNNSVQDLRTEVAVLKDRSASNPVSVADIALLKARVSHVENWAQDISDRLRDHQKQPHPVRGPAQ